MGCNRVSVEAAFDTVIGKAGFAKELLAHLQDADPEDAAVKVLDRNFAGLISTLADTLHLAREQESESRRAQRVGRIIDEFAEDHPTGCLRDKALTTLRRVDAAADDTTAGDMIRAGTARLRRNFELSMDPLTRVPEFAAFLSELRNIPLLVILSDQGRITGEELEQEAGTTNEGND